MSSVRRTLRVAVNTLSIMPGEIGGGERYLVQLLNAICRVDGNNEYVFLVNEHNHQIFPDAPNVTKKTHWASKKYRAGRLLWEQVGLPLQLRPASYDVLFSPANIAPAARLACASVLTIHDLNWLSVRWHQRGPEGALQALLVAQSARSADQIIAVSETTQLNLMSWLGIERTKTTVVYEGVDLAFWGGATPTSRSNTILAVATSHPHKNLDGLVRAFSILKTSNPRFRDWRLTIAGMPGRGHRSLIALIAQLGLEHDVTLTGRVSDVELRSLYSGAAVFVLPSKKEGFGLPLLEAMACHTPVVSSQAGSLGEVGGDAAVYFNPYDPADIATKLAKVISSDALREELVRKGRRRIERFSWDLTARHTVQVFEAAARKQRRSAKPIP